MDAYEKGFFDGYSNQHRNPYTPHSWDWDQYEEGYQDGQQKAQEELR